VRRCYRGEKRNPPQLGPPDAFDRVGLASFLLTNSSGKRAEKRFWKTRRRRCNLRVLKKNGSYCITCLTR